MYRFALLILVSLTLVAPAQATSLTAQEILQQFNLVSFGTVTSTSHVDGRAYIGGSVSGGEYAQHPFDTPASQYAGLTVAGNAANVKVNGLGAVIQGSLSDSTINSGSTVVLGSATNTNFNGPAYVPDSISGNKFNGRQDSSLGTSTAATVATSTDFQTVLTALSDQLRTLTADSSYTTADSSYTTTGNRATFTATAGSDGIAVFNITGSAIFTSAIGEYAFNVPDAVQSIIINVDAANATIASNFLGGSAVNLGKKILWNFYNATSLTINNQFGGSILAVHAALTNEQNIEGGVYVNSLTQRGEIHLQPFSGTLPSTPSRPVPEPSTLLSLACGLLVLARVTRKQQSGRNNRGQSTVVGCLVFVFVLVAGYSSAGATSYAFTSSDGSGTANDTMDLEHGYYYGWSIANGMAKSLGTELQSGYTLVSATLTYKNIWDWTKEKDDQLNSFLLSAPPPIPGKTETVGVEINGVKQGHTVYTYTKTDIATKTVTRSSSTYTPSGKYADYTIDSVTTATNRKGKISYKYNLVKKTTTTQTSTSATPPVGYTLAKTEFVQDQVTLGKGIALSENLWERSDQESETDVNWGNTIASYRIQDKDGDPTNPWNDPYGGDSSKKNDLIYQFDQNSLYALFTSALDGSFGIGIDPDCHYYNDGIVLEIVTAPAHTPEPATMLLFGTGLIGLAAMARRK